MNRFLSKALSEAHAPQAHPNFAEGAGKACTLCKTKSGEMHPRPAPWLG